MAHGRRAGLLGYPAIALIAWAATQTVALAANPQCPERRATSPAVEEIAERHIGGNAAAQGHANYAGAEGRPPPTKSAIDIKRSWAKFVLPGEEWRDQAIMFFTIQNRKLPATDREVINIPFDVYWCLAAKGDIVLLSDMSNDHYTRIASIDRERQTVDLIDRWPNILLEFAGVAPVPFTAPAGSGSSATGAKLVRFSRSDFERLFVAAIILDTADFVHLLEQSLPREAWTPELPIAVGRSLLYAGKYKSFPAPAADFIIDGVRAAGRAGKQDLVDESIPAMFAAVAMAHSFHLAEGNQKAAAIARKYLDDIVARYGSAPMQRLDAEDAVRIGVFASAAKDWATALLFLGQAVEKNARDHRAYLFRSEARHKILQIVGANRDEVVAAARQAQKDAETALELIAAREREFKQRISDGEQNRGVYWEWGVDAAQEDEAEYAELRAHRDEASRLRDTFRRLLGELEGAAAPAQPRQ